ncbi:hypothetical protein [Sediminicoccus sp. BL-A-41-H5]|uniref:hypothetical protein n=1 Tax=Sediminicoccus sp. BL-A-41-H5 TaxID=3421106 RepID=UPI003D67AE09
MTEADLANFALGEEITLSVVVARLPLEEGEVDEVDDGQFVDIPHRRYWFSGTLDLWPQDAWTAVMQGAQTVTAFQADAGRYRSVWAPNEETAEFIVPRDRLVVRHAELERFEAAQAAAAYEPAPPPAVPQLGQRGAPARYDWDAFWCELAVMLQVEGMPETQAAVIRRMEAWFAKRGQFPDPSTVKRKVTLLWRRHAEALARPAA